MHCLIIDDNSKTSATLAAMLEALQVVTSVHKAVQPYLIRSLMAAEPIDVIFIRVRLWNYAVFEKLESMPAIVFLTGGRDKLTEKPATSVKYRLREPLRPFDLEMLMSRLDKERVIESPSFLFISYEGRHHRIHFNDIKMIERMRMSYVRIFTNDTVYLVSGTLTRWLQHLPPDRFIRVSDTLILPIEEVQKINGTNYVFQGRTIPLTFRFAAKAKKELGQQDDYSLLPVL